MLLVLEDKPPWLFEAQQLWLEGEKALVLRIECLPVALCTHQTGGVYIVFFVVDFDSCHDLSRCEMILCQL